MKFTGIYLFQVRYQCYNFIEFIKSSMNIFRGEMSVLKIQCKKTDDRFRLGYLCYTTRYNFIY